MLDFRKILKKKKKIKIKEWRNLFKRPHKIFLGLSQINPKSFYMWTDFWT